MDGWPTIALIAWVIGVPIIGAAYTFIVWTRKTTDPCAHTIARLRAHAARERRLAEDLEQSARDQMQAAYGDVPNLPEKING